MTRMKDLFHNMSLRYKIMLGYSFMFMLAIAVENAVIFSTARRYTKNYIESSLEKSTDNLLNIVTTSVDVSVRNYLRAVANSNIEVVGLIYDQYKLGNFSEAAAKEMAKVMLLNQKIGRHGFIYCIDSSGVVKIHPDNSLVGTDLSRHDVVREQKRRKSGYLEYKGTYPFPDDDVARPKAMHMAYFEPWDWIISVSSYQMEFKEIFNINDFRKSILSMTFGKRGYPYIMDSQGNLVVHPTLQGTNLYNAKDAAGRLYAREICEKKSGRMVYQQPSSGKEDSEEILAVFNYIPELDWIVVSNSYIEELGETLKAIRYSGLTLFAVMLLLVFPVVWWINSSITRPIHELTNRFAAGNYTKRIEARWSGEIGRLAEYYNTFIERLQESSRKLRESEEKYRSIFDNATEGIFQSTLDGRFFNINPAMARFMGYDSPEQVFADGIDVRSQFYSRLEDWGMMNTRVSRDGSSSGLEAQITRRDNDKIWVSINVHPVRDESEKTTYYEGTVRDITERKLAEDELRNYHVRLEKMVADRTSELTESNENLQKEIAFRKWAEEELSKKAGLLEGIINNSPSFIIVRDTQGRLIMANNEAEKTFDFRLEEIINKTLHDVLPHEIAEYIRAEDEKVVETRTLYKSNLDHIVDGEIRTFSITKFPLFDLNENVYALCDVATDITELQRARETAEAANRAKSEFLANMSHEIRTPMNAILGFSEILEERIRDARNKKYLSSIRSSGKALLVLINDILDLAKVEAGKLKLEYAAFDPRIVFVEMEQIFSKRISDKKLDFAVEISPTLPEALILDETRLRQILLNLVGNAVKFTDAGYVKLFVDFRGPTDTSDSSEFVFRVEDTGLGIPKEQRDAIFNAFEQQSGQRTAMYGGTGLGLAITKRLVEMMNGEIQVDGEVGQGSKFVVVIKDVKTASIPTPPREKHRNEAVSIRFDAATIIVADDIKLNRKLLKNYMADQAFQIIETENGRDTVDCAEEHRPDLILMDMKMPIMDGYEATRILKNLDHLRHIPVIAVTASVMKEEQEEVLEICDALLKKPVSKTELIDEMRGFLKHSVEALPTDAEPTATGIAYAATDVAPAATGVERKAEIPDSETLARLPELLAILETDWVDVWKELIQTLTINDIEDFAERMKQLGAEYGYLPLLEWGEDLLTRAVMFDMDKLPGTLGEFAGIVQRISNHIESPT
ncbi:MAG: PAS domain S-box protein [Proteobacteria bacterium]|nr:PAS domain S-box protein [Pseudomonadota bacterium]